MRKIYFSIFAMLLLTINSIAQENMYAKQLIIANGGVYSNPDDFVTMAAYDLIAKEYQVFDEIKTQSTQCAIVDEGFAYVAAQDSLVKYDLNTYTRVAAIELTALKKLAIYENKLIVARQYPATENCIYILNKEDLTELAVLDPSGEASGIAVVGDSAYIAIPGAYGTEEGKLAIVDLQNNVIDREINFGARAKGLKDVLSNGSKIYTVNSHFCDYVNNVYSISEYDIETGDTATTMFSGDYYGFYGSSIITDSVILFPLSFDIASYNIYDKTMDVFTTMYPSSMAYEPLTSEVFIAESNFVDWGKLYSFNTSGVAINDTVDIGVSPEGFAIDYRELPFLSDDLVCWVGEGANESVLVVDWNDGTEDESFAWGYKWNGDATAEDMINAINELDTRVNFNIEGGFLNDIVYDYDGVSHSGVGGDPDYWSTWSGTTCMNWYMNMGISAQLTNGSWFGCSYGWNPAPSQPDVPVAVGTLPVAVSENANFTNVFKVHPNPCIDEISLEGFEGKLQTVQVYDFSGKLVRDITIVEKKINMRDLPQGVYVLKVITDSRIYTERMIKQ